MGSIMKFQYEEDNNMPGDINHKEVDAQQEQERKKAELERVMIDTKERKLIGEGIYDPLHNPPPDTLRMRVKELVTRHRELTAEMNDLESTLYKTRGVSRKDYDNIEDMLSDASKDQRPSIKLLYARYKQVKCALQIFDDLHLIIHVPHPDVRNALFGGEATERTENTENTDNIGIGMW